MEIEECVITKIRERRDAGRKKYGITMERGDLSILEWITHAQEEALDFAIYLEKLKQSFNMNYTVGTCSNCGGPVTIPMNWMATIPSVPQCEKCHSTPENPYGPVIKMKPFKPFEKQ